MKKIYFKFILLVLVSIFLTIMLIGYSLAWFSQTKPLYPSIKTKELEVVADIYFVSSNNPEEKIYPSYENHLISNKNVLIIDVVNIDSINYIENLYVDLKLKGTITSFVRVKPYEEFYKYNIITKINPLTQEEEIVEMGGIEKQGLVLYNIINESNWFDNRQYDGFLYYKGTVNNSSLEEELTIPFIRGINNLNNLFPLQINITPTSYEGYTVSWSIKAEAIQATRFKQLWNFDKLPWEE